MIIVKPRENESIERLIRRFKKKVLKDGTLRLLRNKTYFESKSEKKHREKRSPKRHK